MYFLRTLSWLLLTLVCVSCVPLGIDTIKPERLHEPVFVVVPASPSLSQQKFASAIEGELINSGMRVIERPTFKSVRIEVRGQEANTKEVASADVAGFINAGLLKKKDEGRIIQSFLEMEDSPANYRINTYAGSKTIELIDRKNKQIISVFTRSSMRSGDAPSRLYRLLDTLGFEVVELPNRLKSEQNETKPLVSATAKPSPLITVIPSSDIFLEAPFQLYTQELLVRLGLNVIRPPTPRYKEQATSTSKVAGKSNTQDSASRAASSTRIESYWEYDETPADLILRTSFYGNVIKVIENKTKRVLKIVTLSNNVTSQNEDLKKLSRELSAVGVTGKFDPQPPKDKLQDSGAEQVST